MSKMLRAREVARLLDISTATLHRLVDEGKIPAVQLGERSLRFRESDIKSLTGEAPPVQTIDAPAVARFLERIGPEAVAAEQAQYEAALAIENQMAADDAAGNGSGDVAK